MITALEGEYRNRLVVKDADGLHVMGRFVRALLLNQLREPCKVKVMEKLNLAVAIDPAGYEGSALTMTFGGGRVVLERGMVTKADVVLRCEPAVLMKLARMPAGPAAVKFFVGSEGRDLISRMLSGDLKIKGVARHPLGMMKFANFLAPPAS